jgi:hypothetical protein
MKEAFCRGEIFNSHYGSMPSLSTEKVTEGYSIQSLRMKRAEEDESIIRF